MSSKAIRIFTLIAVTFGIFFGITLVFNWIFGRRAESKVNQSELIRALIRDLENSDRMVRTSAIHQLGKIGPPAERALPAMKEALRDAFKEKFNEDMLIAKATDAALLQITGSGDLSDLWWKELSQERREAKAKAESDHEAKTEHR